MTQWRSEFRPMPIAPQPVLHGPLADLLEWQAMAQGAYSVNTLRAQKADGAIFQAYCESVGEPFLPANPHTVRAFIGAQVKAGKKPATIQRYIATISRVHTAAHLHNPCSSEAVRLGLKKMGRETSAPPAVGSEPIASAPCSVSPMKPWPGAASSWRSSSVTLISIRTAPARR